MAFGLVFGVAIVVGGLLDMVNAGSGLAELDDELAEWGSEHASSAAVDVLELITHLGGTWVVAAALVDHRRRRVPPHATRSRCWSSWPWSGSARTWSST